VLVEAADRPGLLRDISEVFAKDKMNVTGVHSATTRDRAREQGKARMSFTVEVNDAARLPAVLNQIQRVAGVLHARRK
jgi:GTP pyrophosphokinase